MPPGLTNSVRTESGVFVAAERERRLAIWAELSNATDIGAVEPAELRRLRVYGGAQGVWYDKQTTEQIEPGGITVSILHTGKNYEDDLLDDGIIYHYPSTNRPQARDVAEINAPKSASRLGMPIIAILPSRTTRRLRRVELGRIEAWNDEEEQFLIVFDNTDFSPAFSQPSDDFVLTDDEPSTAVTSKTRRSARQVNFRMNVLARYGVKCAFCNISESRLLDAGHIRPVSENGSFHVGNGLPMCPTHNRAFDRRLAKIVPESLVIEPGRSTSLGVTRTDISHLDSKPHPAAIHWAWNRPPTERG